VRRSSLRRGSSSTARSPLPLSSSRRSTTCFGKLVSGSALLGFEHVIEMYKPAPQLRYGYYVLPFLWRDRIVGRRSEVRAERRLARRQGAPRGAGRPPLTRARRGIRPGSRPAPAHRPPRARRAMRIVTADMRRTVSTCKRSASIGLPPRCHRVPPKCTVAAENWPGAGVSAEHGGMRVHNRSGS